ncbi:MAG: hypothetical protein WBV78_20670, partial [Roseobacter sp.]
LTWQKLILMTALKEPLHRHNAHSRSEAVMQIADKAHSSSEAVVQIADNAQHLHPDKFCPDCRTKRSPHLATTHPEFARMWHPPKNGDMDLSRFDAAPFIAFTAPNETDYGTETDG